MPRDVGLKQLQDLGYPGVYVINVPKAVKMYYKIGMSSEDIEKRLASYILAYPWGFDIVAILLYPRADRYLKPREAETKILQHFKDERVFRYPGMQSSEWLRLKGKKQTNELKKLMTEIAQETCGKLSWFSSSQASIFPRRACKRCNKYSFDAPILPSSTQYMISSRC